MQKEDPLERIERQEREKKQGGSLKSLVIILSVIAAALLIGFVVVLMGKNKLIGELNVEKQDLTNQIVALQQDYESLSSDYDSINCQLDSSREEVNQLVEKIKATDARNRSKIRQYEKELGTLRSIMRNYIVQIDSLNALNQKLTAEAAMAKKEAAESKRQNEKLTSQVENLSSKVAVGSVIKARGLRLDAYNASDKVTDRSSRVKYLIASLSLVDNDLAPKGPVRVFLRAYDPSGTLLVDGNGWQFTVDGVTMDASAAREVDYEGKEVDLAIYINNIPALTKGVYTIEAFTAQGKIGSAEMLLR